MRKLNKGMPVSQFFSLLDKNIDHFFLLLTGDDKNTDSYNVP